jgi:hypothetical protein
MRCKTCDYPLWNLTTRHCPECGDGFRPSDFDFVRSSVQFRCPHCETAYYGTSRRGHLEPSEFECTVCHHVVAMDDMVLQPAPGFTDAQTDPARNPWLERHRHSWLRSLWDTTWQSIRDPGSLVRGLDEKTPSWPAWWYMFLINVVVLVGIVLPVTVLTMLFAYGMGGLPSPAALFAAMGGGFAAVMIGSLVVTVMFVAVWGPITQGLLRIGGGRPQFGVKRTFDALCYSSGTYISSIIPCIGWNLGWIWWLVAAVIMVRDVQRVSGLRATLAVLAWPGFALVGSIALYVAWVGYSMTQVMTIQQTRSTAAAQTETSLVAGALVAYAAVNDAGPEHALELVVDGQLTTRSLCSVQSNTNLARVPVGEHPLSRLPLGSLDLRKAVDEEVALMPVDTVAYRTGDYVFTHRGADLGSGDGELWIVLRILDPDVNPAPSSIWIGRADGTVTEVRGDFGAALDEQNAYRESIGLPALPDPLTLRHRRPPPGDASTDP